MPANPVQILGTDGLYTFDDYLRKIKALFSFHLNAVAPKQDSL
jgi:hypothetical protein